MVSSIRDHWVTATVFPRGPYDGINSRTSVSSPGPRAKTPSGVYGRKTLHPLFSNLCSNRTAVSQIWRGQTGPKPDIGNVARTSSQRFRLLTLTVSGSAFAALVPRARYFFTNRAPNGVYGPQKSVYLSRPLRELPSFHSCTGAYPSFTFIMDIQLRDH